MDTLASYINAAQRGGLDSILRTLYGDAALSVQTQRYQGVLNRMEKWTTGSKAVLVSAPGRTELGGNHTDHNNGVVLAAAVNFDCLAVASPVEGNTLRIRSEGFPDVIEVDIDDLSHREEEEGTSTALVRGVLDGFRNEGLDIGAFDACIAGDVHVGAGLSSSAAFEVCLGQILNYLFNDGQVTPLKLAAIGRRAENLHFGKPCGFMDQLACAAQGILSIDFNSQADPDVQEIDFDFTATGYQLVVVDTGGSHADLTPEYAAIPDEMRAASQALGKDYARGLTIENVLDAAPQIRKAAGDRGVLRLIHFIEENERAILQADALRAGNMSRFLELVKQSGDSSWRLLQNCTSTTNFLEQGIPLALTLTERFLGGQGAWRVQGGGFAGTIQAYVPVERVEAYRTFMEGIYGPGSVVPLRIRKPGNEYIRPTWTGGDKD